MAYIGRGTENISNVEVLDNLTFDGSASYTLQKSSTNFVPSSANNLLISISGVVQQGNFTVSGSTITFDTTVSASDTCDWILHYGTGLITTVADGAITEAKLGSSAVTTAKINNGAITSAKLDSGLALGKIGQVVQGTFNGTDTITSTSYVTTSLNASITPSSSSSKILITLGLTMDNNASMRADATIYRGGTNLLNGLNNNSALISFNSIANGRIIAMQSNSFLDSPSTTSSTTYTVYMKVQSSTVQLYGLEATSTITLMEVLA